MIKRVCKYCAELFIVVNFADPVCQCGEQE